MSVMQDITQVQSEIMCPISREIFEHPLLCADGFSYEKSFISKWVSKNKVSPMLGSKLDNESLRENKTLCSYLTIYKGLKQRLTSRKPKKEASLPLKEEPTWPPALKAKFDQTLDHYYKSTLELEDCCKMMTEVYEANPNNFEAVMNYANILRFGTHFDKSLEMVKKLKELRPDSLIPKYMRVRILAESGKKEEAAKRLMKVQVGNRVEDHTLVEVRFMSYSLLSTGNRDRAYMVISTYLKVVPEDARALSHYIYINLLQENFKIVINMAKSYLKAHPDDVSIMFHQAKAYTKIDKKEKAISIYKKIATISIDKAVKSKALYESAVNRDCTTGFEEMVKELEESYKLDPREEADGYLAALYADKKMFDKAEEWIEVCAKRTDIMSDQVYLGIKAQIEEHKKLYDQAVSSYIRLAEIDSANSLYYNDKIEEILLKQAHSSKQHHIPHRSSYKNLCNTVSWFTYYMC
eukprot:TRINITY_DN1322_c0_g1_i1.p3 TRINITY_DN1322_c0_g1~~TRINITY_DN1322_c0_g1_i1.p3  ORF type:complete len:465 (-),score=56.93 TRINITY_DN1322_c0_g1_i1:4433-5827(-)